MQLVEQYECRQTTPTITPARHGGPRQHASVFCRRETLTIFVYYDQRHRAASTLPQPSAAGAWAIEIALEAAFRAVGLGR